MGIPEGDVHLPVVWERRLGNGICFGRGAKVFCVATGGAQRRKGRRKKGRRDQLWRLCLGRRRKTEGGAGAWRERSDRKVRRGEAAVAAGRDQACMERRTGGTERKGGPVPPGLVPERRRPEFGGLARGRDDICRR
jgi:hypothetical protein